MRRGGVEERCEENGGFEIFHQVLDGYVNMFTKNK